MKNTILQERDDKAFLTNPNEWPLWPYCPVKLRGRAMEEGGLGIVIEEDGAVSPAPVVYLIGLFELRTVPISTAKKIEYKSFEDLLAAGWVVD